MVLASKVRREPHVGGVSLATPPRPLISLVICTMLGFPACMRMLWPWLQVLTMLPFIALTEGMSAATGAEAQVLERPGLYRQLTEPPCSYCSTQNRKALIRPDDRVLAWIRGPHNGGSFPLRHFLSAPRVIND